jgi:multisubunit Na+/H+ antiporter MnhB subunit
MNEAVKIFQEFAVANVYNDNITNTWLDEISSLCVKNDVHAHLAKNFTNLIKTGVIGVSVSLLLIIHVDCHLSFTNHLLLHNNE